MNKLQGAKDALMSYQKRQLPKQHRSRRRNEKPERITEKECLIWLNKGGFSVDIVDCKGTYSDYLDRYVEGETDPGFSDIVGNDDVGRSTYVELKAKGRRTNLSPAQYKFLKKKVESNCFAIVTDSVEFLEQSYKSWARLKDRREHVLAQRFLMSILPMPSKMKDDGQPLF